MVDVSDNEAFLPVPFLHTYCGWWFSCHIYTFFLCSFCAVSLTLILIFCTVVKPRTGMKITHILTSSAGISRQRSSPGDWGSPSKVSKWRLPLVWVHKRVWGEDQSNTSSFAMILCLTLVTLLWFVSYGWTCMSVVTRLMTMINLLKHVTC